MSISIKSPQQINKMRVAGKLASSVLEMIGEHVKAGVTTEVLDQICHNFIVNDLDCIPAPLNYNGFPKSICTSVNSVVCHGIPGNKKLKKGLIFYNFFRLIQPLSNRNDWFRATQSSVNPSAKELERSQQARIGVVAENQFNCDTVRI